MAIEQLELLYSYLRTARDEDDNLEIDPPAATADGQPYPSNACRIRTYRTALTSPSAPACSLCNAGSGDEEEDDDDGEDEDGKGVSAKDPGARDRQKKKKSNSVKISGNQDRQRYKKRALAAGDDLDEHARRYPEEDEDEDIPEALAKSGGARDRQRRKKALADAVNAPVEVEAKISGVLDRQRRKKFSLAEDAEIADGSDQFEAEDEVLGPDAKVSGARDRQRRKKLVLSETAQGNVLAKDAGRSDRQRRKKTVVADWDEDEADGERGDESRESELVQLTGLIREVIDRILPQPLAKASGARDRQQKKKR